MDPNEAAKRRRIAVACVCAVVAVGAGGALFLLEPGHRRFLGLGLGGVLRAALYASLGTLAVTALRAALSLRCRERRITVEELRSRARSRV